MNNFNNIIFQKDPKYFNRYFFKKISIRLNKYNIFLRFIIRSKNKLLSFSNNKYYSANKKLFNFMKKIIYRFLGDFISLLNYENN